MRNPFTMVYLFDCDSRSGYITRIPRFLALWIIRTSPMRLDYTTHTKYL